MTNGRRPPRPRPKVEVAHVGGFNWYCSANHLYPERGSGWHHRLDAAITLATCHVVVCHPLNPERIVMVNVNVI